MTLVDTSVWIDHLHRADPGLEWILTQRLAIVHPLVLGEIACGRLARREMVLTMLRFLPVAPSASHDEVLQLVESRCLHGRGLGVVDAHLLASALIGGLALWTRDRSLLAAAKLLAIPTDPDAALG